MDFSGYNTENPICATSRQSRAQIGRSTATAQPLSISSGDYVSGLLHRACSANFTKPPREIPTACPKTDGDETIPR